MNDSPENADESKRTEIERQTCEARRLQAAVDAGDVAAFEPTARLYEDGRGVERDWRRAFELRRQAAEAGDPNAQTGLARAFRYGVGVAPNLKAAFDWGVRALETPAFEERDAALGLVGEFYFNGEGVVERDKKRAFSLFWEARFSDDATALDGIASCRRDGIGDDAGEAAKTEAFWRRRAFETARRKAERGSAVDAAIVAFYFRDGVGVESDSNEALAWSRRAADAGLGVALYDVGFSFETGVGVARDETRAFEFYRRAADVENPDALCALGLARLNGRSTTAANGERFEIAPDVDEAFRYFKRAAATGFPPAFFFLALCVGNGWGRPADDAEAFALLRRSAEGGFSTAQNELADRLSFRNDARSRRESLRWRREAAEQDLPEARLELGRSLVDGLDGERDPVEGVRQLCAAADAGSAEAAFLASQCAALGVGTERDRTASLRLLETAANGGFSAAQNELGLLYFTGGDGVERNGRRAVALFGAAAARLHPAATANFALCLEQGVGLAPDPRAAEYFLRVAAGLGDASAALELSDRFYEGRDVDKNELFATRWLEIAAQNGDLDAARRLAFRFWEGDGTPLDRRRALDFWNAAAEAGDEDAVEERLRAELGLRVASLFCVLDAESARSTNERGAFELARPVATAFFSVDATRFDRPR